jgi:hypothetical protein
MSIGLLFVFEMPLWVVAQLAHLSQGRKPRHAYMSGFAHGLSISPLFLALKEAIFRYIYPTNFPGLLPAFTHQSFLHFSSLR